METADSASFPASPAAVRVDQLPADAPVLARIVFWTLQPALLIAMAAAWLAAPDEPALFGLTFVAVHFLIGALEYRVPARPGWRHPAAEKLGVLCIAMAGSAVADLAAGLYSEHLSVPLQALRVALHLDVWPHHWPLVVQMLMVFFLAELIWYWMHRTHHRWSFVWRASAHGAHHAFKKLNAINAGANHPVELFLIVLPSILVDLLFGVGAPAYGAVLFGLVQTAVVHSNLRLNSRLIGWLLTTNAWHIRHHSADLAESNTNFACSAIVWDRIFGTFGDGAVIDAGIGPREPSTLEKLLMPIREPAGSVVAPGER